MRNAGLDGAQAGIKIAERNINNLRYADDTTLMAESKEELEPLDESEKLKSWLKLKIQKRQRNQRSNCQHLLDHQKSKRVPEKHLILFY